MTASRTWHGHDANAPVSHSPTGGRQAEVGRGGRRLKMGLAGVIAVALATLATVWWRGDTIDRSFFLPVQRLPGSYHIVYAEGAAHGTEDLWVRRPFESVDQTLSGPPPGDILYVSTVSRLGHQVLRAGPAAQSALVDVPVTASPADVRLDAVYAAARKARLLRFREDDTVAGRRCRVVRSAQSLRSTPLLPLAPGATSYVDTCVDAAGLILREQIVHDGAVASSRTAVLVEVGATAGDRGADSATGAPTPSDQGGGSITALTPDSLPPGRTWTLPRPPAGFRLRGRYVVVLSQVVTLQDVYVRGPDVIVVEQGVSTNNARFALPTGGRPVDLGVLGRGQLVLAATASSVVAEPAGESKFVRVTGTVDPRLLISTAEALVSIDNGSRNTLVTIPGGVP